MMTSVQLLRVLVVEDSLVNQKMLTALLAQRDCAIEVALDGQEAINILVALQFDLILMDVQMPVMDGLTATRLIRQQEATADRHTTIVAVTAGVDRQVCLDAGMDDHVSKPIRPAVLDELLSRIRHDNSL